MSGECGDPEHGPGCGFEPPTGRPASWYVELDGAVVELTRRERRVAELVCGGLGRTAIAAMMEMSPKTFDTHRSHVMRKMGCANEVQLVRLAIKRGWVEL